MRAKASVTEPQKLLLMVSANCVISILNLNCLMAVICSKRVLHGTALAS